MIVTIYVLPPIIPTDIIDTLYYYMVLRIIVNSFFILLCSRGKDNIDENRDFRYV